MTSLWWTTLIFPVTLPLINSFPYFLLPYSIDVGLTLSYWKLSCWYLSFVFIFPAQTFARHKIMSPGLWPERIRVIRYTKYHVNSWNQLQKQQQPRRGGRHLPATARTIGESLQWSRNGRDSVSNHQPHDCLLNRLFRSRSKRTSRLRVTGPCAWNSPVTGEFPAQMASNADNVSIWWRHHAWPNIHSPSRCQNIMAWKRFPH